MGDRTRLTRRAGLALIATGAATAVPYTRGMTSTVADRLANVGTAADPNALLGIQGIGQSPREEITVVNNADGPMTVTVQTTNFTIQSPGSGTETTFSASSSGTTVTFSPENGQTDAVQFTGVIDGGSGQSATIQFTRSITVPVAPQPGDTYRIRNVHSGLYLTADAPSGGSWWNPDPGDVYQDTWQGSDAQRWTVGTNNGASTLEHVSSGALLAVGDPAGGNSFEEVVTSGSLWTGSDERWNLTENADGSYRIESVPNSPDVVDVEAGSTTAGANVIAYQWKGNDAAIGNQKWTFDPA